MIPRATLRALHSARRDLAQAWSRDLFRVRRRLRNIDRTLIATYLASHQVRKLHLGCGANLLEGWLNSNFYPDSPRVLHLDARGRFPFEGEQFDYVFSEHMIEHIAYADGAAMLRECFRVLRPGGTVRISTPDLAFLMDLRRSDRTALQDDYVRWSTQKFVPSAPRADETFVINNFVRRWGHLFIYDEKTLRGAFADAGFTHIVRCPMNESDDPALAGLEEHKKIPAGFRELETMTLEGTRPAGR